MSNKDQDQKTLLKLQETVIQGVGRTLTKEVMTEFCKATFTEFCKSIPHTIVTIFRDQEFQWLDTLKIDMHHLLHTEQEYEYLVPLELGDVVNVTTRLVVFRERKEMQFYTLESNMDCKNITKIIARSSFVVKK